MIESQSESILPGRCDTSPNDDITAAGASGALPQSKDELMRRLTTMQSQGNRDTQYLMHLQRENRAMRQEKAREATERTLMACEDYTYTPEGARRLQRYQEELRMAEEDEFSAALREVMRQELKEAFVEQVRQEALLRERQAEEEKVRKRAEAEKRRAAVLERIRKQQEEEEAARRAVQEAEQQRVDREEARLQRDRAMMPLEDELSAAGEQAFRDDLARSEAAAAEAARIAAYEEAQRAKEATEAVDRAARLEALRLKKVRLQEMKEGLGLGLGLADGAQAGPDHRERAAALAREDARRQAKELRIQRKARFVSTRIKRGEPVQEILQQGPAASAAASADGGGAPNTAVTPQSPMRERESVRLQKQREEEVETEAEEHSSPSAPATAAGSGPQPSAGSPQVCFVFLVFFFVFGIFSIYIYIYICIKTMNGLCVTSS